MRACWLTGLLLLGCGSTESSGSSGTQASGSAANLTGSGSSGSETTGGALASSTGVSGSGGDYFVTADLDGETLNATLDVKAYWFDGLLQGWIGVTGTADSRTWHFVILNSNVNTACNGGYITLQDLTDDSVGSILATYPEGGSCSVTVTEAAPNVGDVIEGTFEGVLSSFEEPMVTVTNGRFRALRTPDETL